MSRATLVVPSVFTKQEIQEIYNVPAGRIVVIANAVSETFVSSLKATSLEDTNRVAQKYHLPKNYWLYVGTLQPRKNIPYLLQILCEIKKRVPTTKLVLVGDREGHHFDQRIDQALRELQLEKDVIFPGYITDEDLPALYQGAELFVFPSMYEGFGIPLLEALAAGTPVAASLIPPHQEVAGEAAAYFPLESLAIAAEILYNFSVKTQTAGLLKNGYIKPNLDFSWDTSAKNLAELYSRLAEK
jgi:glycosyltransferase involved in cell wall biosynthesis